MQTPNKKRQRHTVHFTTHIKPSAKAELQRIAQAEGLPTSRVGAVAIEEWLARRSHIQHRGIFQPMIEHAIAKAMRAYSSRIAILLVRSMFTSEQTRALVTNILARQPGMNQPVLDTILNGTSDTAKGNITRITPQLATLLREVDQWLEQGASNAHD